MDVGLQGVVFIWGYIFWPLIISLVFSAFRSTKQIEFFLSSLLVGYIVFLPPHILQILGLFRSFSQTIVTTFMYIVFWSPVATAIILTIIYKKVSNSKGLEIEQT